MKVTDFGGSYDGDSSFNLEKVFSAKYDGFNEVMISGGHHFPHLLILIQDSLAALFFIENELDAGYSSIAPQAAAGHHHTITFETGAPGQKIEISDRAIVSLSVAEAAAKEFLITQRMPQSVSWMKL